MPATVLVLVETINDYLPILEHQGFHLILAPTPAERAEAISTHGARIDAVLMSGDAASLRSNPDVVEAYLGGHQRVDYHAVKHYRRRKRWLS